MTRDQVLPYVSFGVDQTLQTHSPTSMPENARLIGWQCGFEPLFVAVWSEDCALDDAAATDIATEFLSARNWFAGDATQPDYVL